MRSGLMILSILFVIVNNSFLFLYGFLPNFVTLTVLGVIFLINELGLAYYGSKRRLGLRAPLSGFLIGSMFFFWMVLDHSSLGKYEYLYNVSISFFVYSAVYTSLYFLFKKAASRVS